MHHNESAPSLNAMPNIGNFSNNISEENVIPMPAQFDLSTFQTFTNGFLPTNFAINNSGMVLPTIDAMNIPFYSNMKMGNLTSNQSDWDIVKAALSLNVSTPDFSSNSQDIQGNSMIPSQTNNNSDKSQYMENDGERHNIRTKNYTIANDRNGASTKSTEENNRLHHDLKENSDNKETEIEKRLQINQTAASYHHPSDQATRYLHSSLAQINDPITSVKNHKAFTSKNDKISKDVNENPLAQDVGNEISQTKDNSLVQSGPTQSGNRAFPWERKNDTGNVAREATIPRHSTERNRLSHLEDAIKPNNYAAKSSGNKFSNANGKDISIRTEIVKNKRLHDGSYDLQSSDLSHSNLKALSVSNSNANGKNQINHKTTVDNMKEGTFANKVDIMQSSKKKHNQDIFLSNDLDTLNIGSDDPPSKTSQHDSTSADNTPNDDNCQGKKYVESNKTRNYNNRKSVTSNIDTDNKTESSNTDSTKKPTKVFKTAPPGTGQLHQTNKYNPSWVDLNNYRGARFFVIKSYYEDDIYYSIKSSLWSSTEYGNKKLNRAYCDCQGTSFIYLFFSVNGSGHFCGVARMTSEVFYEKSVSLWQQNKWEGKFSVQWIYVKDVPNFALKHIRLENNNYKAITNSRDCQEVPGDSARTAMKIIHHYQHETSIFDDFEYYDNKLKQKVSTFRFIILMLAIPV